MWDFSGDEWVFLLIATFVGFGLIVRWYLAILLIQNIRGGGSNRLTLALMLPAALTGLYFVLQNWSDPYTVAGHLDYVTLFMLGGALWMMVCAQWIFPLFGLNFIDDAIERRNPAAAVAIAGAAIAVCVVYTLCNIGAGPTIWTTLIPALVATIALIGLWGLLELITSTTEAITIDRDVATAVRHAAMLIACSVVLGRAMAGDFLNWPQTFVDFAVLGWPALLIVAVAAAISRITRPTPQRPTRSVLLAGIVPALIYLLLALAGFLILGAPSVGQLPVQQGALP